MLNAKTESTAYKVITQDDLDVQTATVTSNGITINLWKSGHVVNANINQTGTVSKSGYNSGLATIPEGFRPIEQQLIYYTGIAGASTNGNGKWYINTDGSVGDFSTTTGNIERNASATWITN